MGVVNYMQLFFPALPVNEAFARLAISGFILPLNPTMEELADIKTAVSEAVTNAVVHGYGDGTGVVRLEASYTEEEVLRVDVRDNGRGIEDIEQARQPFFTTARGEERSGMGFTVMESFMDVVEVRSAPGKGTDVRMYKALGARDRAIPQRA